MTSNNITVTVRSVQRDARFHLLLKFQNINIELSETNLNSTILFT